MAMCSTCQGSGKVGNHSCPACGGVGYFEGGKSADDFAHGKSGRKSCFVASTEILTAKGHKEISDISVDDRVISINTKTRVTEARRVVKLKEHNRPAQIWNIKIAGWPKTIRTTKNHSVFTHRGWVTVENLIAGDRVTLVSVDHSISSAPIDQVINTEICLPTYNLVTLGECNYLADGLLAHNFTHLRSLRSAFINMFYGGGENRKDRFGGRRTVELIQDI